MVPPQVQQVFWVSKLCFLYSALSPPSMLFSLCRDLCWLGALNNLSESAFDSIRVARWTNVSAVSHIMSLTCGSFGILWGQAVIVFVKIKVIDDDL